MLRLAEQADVFVQNMRQGVMDKLRLNYANVSERNPQIIYASASGYGSKGPHRKWPAMDILGQARGGTMMTQGPPTLPPIFSFGGMADQVGAILAELRDSRSRSGTGRARARASSSMPRCSAGR